MNRSTDTIDFWVPSANQSMRIVFYSCNGLNSTFKTLINSVNLLIQMISEALNLVERSAKVVRSSSAACHVGRRGPDIL